MEEKLERMNAWFDAQIAACAKQQETLLADDRADEADFEKIKANIYDIFRTVLKTAAKESKGYLSSLDQINKLSEDNTGSSGSGASGGAEGSFLLFFNMFFTGGTVIPAMAIWRVITYYLNFPVGCICTYFANNRLPALKLPSRKGATMEEIANGYLPADEGRPSDEEN